MNCLIKIDIKKITLFIILPLIINIKAPGQTSITGTFSHLMDKDIVQLFLYKYGNFPIQIPELSTIYSAEVKNHKFHLTIPIKDNHPYEYRLKLPRQLCEINLNNLVLEKGDRIQISGNDLAVNQFKGKGSAKLNVIKRLNALDTAAESQIFSTKVADLPKILKAESKFVIVTSKYLESQRSKLSRQIYQMLRFRIDYKVSGVYYSLRYMKANDSIRNALKRFWYPIRKFYSFQQAPETALFSSEFTTSLINNFAVKEIVQHNNYNAIFYNRGLKNLYDYFKTHYSGIIREKLITYIILSASRSNEVQYCYKDAIKYIKNKNFKLALDNHCQVIQGSPAYNFTLLDTNMVSHHLSDYKGKVLVLDFWFSGCGGCRYMTPKLKIVEEQFKNNDKVVFISISSDKDLNEWKNSIKNGLYTTSSNEINLYTGGKGMSDPLYQKTNFQGAPTLLLVDKMGRWCENPIDCRQDEGKDLIAKIIKALNQ